MHAHERPRPVGGRLLAAPMPVLIGIFGAATLVMAWRFVFGIGSVSNMGDGFTWGIWEPINVIVFTGIGAGALGVGLLTYLLNRGEYHGLVRPAVLLGAICYTLGGSTIMIALGRYWNAIIIPVVPWWNLSSALLEVAVCVLLYIMVLWVEVLPSIFDRVAESRAPRWAAFGKRWGERLADAMPYVVALAIVLPVMHQSSLGGLALIAGTKVHPLWHTALLPALYLISCLSMGYGAVVTLSTILNLHWGAPHDLALLGRMSKVNAGLLFLYVVLRLADLAWNGKLGLLGLDGFTALFLVELAFFLAPAILFLLPSTQANRGRLFGAGVLAVAAGALYRVDTYVSIYRPGPGITYFPSLAEMLVVVGMASLGVALFILISRLFPVIVPGEGAASRGERRTGTA